MPAPILFIRIAAWRPRSSGREETPRHLPEMSVVFASVFACPGTGLLPTPAQEAVLRGHCGHARYVWNLAVEQHAHWHPGRKGAPGYLEQCRQLTQARAEYPWLAAGSQTVQQQALRDFAQAMAAFFDPGNPAGRPSWRKAGRDEGFRIVGRAVGSGRCAACPGRSARSGCPRPGGCGSAGPARYRRARSPTG